MTKSLKSFTMVKDLSELIQVQKSRRRLDMRDFKITKMTISCFWTKKVTNIRSVSLKISKIWVDRWRKLIWDWWKINNFLRLETGLYLKIGREAKRRMTRLLTRLGLYSSIYTLIRRLQLAWWILEGLLGLEC